MYLGLLIVGFNIHDLISKGISPEENLFLQLSALISSILLSLGCFYEIYFGKSKAS